MDEANQGVVLLNNHFQFLIRKHADDPDFQIEAAYESMVKEKPYKILPSTSMVFKVCIIIIILLYVIIR